MESWSSELSDYRSPFLGVSTFGVIPAPEPWHSPAGSAPPQVLELNLTLLMLLLGHGELKAS